MKKAELKERLDEFIELITNLNNSRHNPSQELEDDIKRLFENLLDDITSGN